MNLFVEILGIMFPIIVIVGLGTLFGRIWKLDMETVNRINMDVFVPALVFSVFSDKSFALSQHLPLAGAGLVVVFIAGVIALLISMITSYSFRTIAPPMMFHNAGNVGLPLMSIAFGKPGLVTGLVLFLIGSLSHYGLGSMILSRGNALLVVLKQPVIWAAVCALFLNMQSITITESVMLPIHMLGQIAIPLMLFSLGVRLASIDFQEWKIGVLFALLIPLVGFCTALVLIKTFDFTQIQAGSLLLFGALPPAVMNFLFAERFNQQPKAVASIVLFGNLFAIITLPVALAFVLTTQS